MMLYDFWILLIGSLASVCCALVGSILVMRKMAMLGDAISHTVLLGIVTAYFVGGQLTGIWMAVGATAVGILTAFLVQWLHQFKVKADAAIGVTFTSLFALAILLISLFAGNIHLDLDHVLYGEISFAPLDTLTWSGLSLGPRALWVLLGMLTLIFAVFYFLRKEIEIISFDALHAAAIGIPTVAIHYVLMTLVSLTAVASFDLVGSILVVAMMVVPPATAYLLARSFRSMLLYGIGFAVLSTFLGYGLARLFDTSIAATMAVSAGVIFVIILCQSSFFGASRRK